MSPTTSGGEELGRAFAVRADRPPAPDCPPPERLWDAVQGRLAARDCEAVVQHTVTCPSCAEDWRLALDVQRQAAAELGSVQPRWMDRRRLSLAAAAVLLLVLGVVSFRFAAPAPRLTYRERPAVAVRPLVADDQALPRGRFLLRWSTAEAGARYNLLVSKEDLEEVVRARGLGEPRFLVPTSALAELPRGTRLLWQVEVMLPGGERRLSPTFFVRLE